MEFRRVVEVFSKNVTVSFRGSGYLIAPGLVITAGHVVSPALAGSCEVRPLDGESPAWQPGRIVWHEPRIDVALLVPSATAVFVGDLTPVEFGVLSGLRPIAVDALGFPEAVATGRRTETLAVSGIASPASMAKSERML